MLWQARHGLIVGRGALNAAGGGGGAATTTWDPAGKHAGNSLSNGNLTVTGTTGYSGGRTIKQLTTGKWYWEMVINTLVTGGGNNTAGGVGQWDGLDYAAGDAYLGSSEFSVGWAQDGTVYFAGGTAGAAATYVAGNVLCYALDVPNRKIHFRNGAGNWNNNASDNPATNTGGYSFAAMTSPDTWFPVYMTGNGAGDVYTARFSSSSWTQSAPSGFVEILA